MEGSLGKGEECKYSMVTPRLQISLVKNAFDTPNTQISQLSSLSITEYWLFTLVIM